MTIAPIQQAYNGLVICAMSKVCVRTSCMHRMTHLYGHGVCWAGIDRDNRVHTRLCSNFSMKAAFRAQTYLQNEKASFIKTKELTYGWCCSWQYWERYMTDERHILLGDYSASVLSGMERGNGGYRTRGCYSPLYTEKTLAKKKRSDDAWRRTFDAEAELNILRREVWASRTTGRR